MPPSLLLVAYCLAVIVASLAGGWLPLAMRLTHVRLQLAMSFVGGAMLAVSLLHLVPHALMGGLNVFAAMGWLLAGFMAMFLLERALPFHHHDMHHGPETAHAGPCEHVSGGRGDAVCGPGSQAHPAGGEAETQLAGSHAQAGHFEPIASAGGLYARRRLTWGAALAGLSLHSALDGMALAASTTAEHGTDAALAGLGVFLAVVLHKPFDALTLGALLAVSGGAKRLRHLVNAAYSLTVPAGAIVFLLARQILADRGTSITAPALAFAAGMFLCIATADLLPELHFHAHDRVKLSLALVLGLVLAIAIISWEETYHEHEERAAADAAVPARSHHCAQRLQAHNGGRMPSRGRPLRWADAELVQRPAPSYLCPPGAHHPPVLPKLGHLSWVIRWAFRPGTRCTTAPGPGKAQSAHNSLM